MKTKYSVLGLLSSVWVCEGSWSLWIRVILGLLLSADQFATYADGYMLGLYFF